MDPFAGIAGHQPALRHLASQLESGRLAHAYLFVGEPGLGKTEVARRLAQALLPELPLARHPDYWEDDRREALKIDEVRLLPDRQPEFHQQSLQAFLNLMPGVGRRRVAVISNVGRLADPIQGILLKTLEEPQPGRVLILTTPSLSPFVVLPTVVSRCQRVAFHSVPAPEVAKLLEAHGIEAERAAALAELARGRPGWALTAARDPQVLARHAVWEERLEEVFGAPADTALKLAAELDAANFAWRGSDRAAEDPVQFALGAWQLHLRRRMLTAARPGVWARLLERSYDTAGHLEQNVSPRLALEVFLLECRRAS
ncbi:MAG TPA: AAA family ATPase [Candidatus Dormibacteraeota bacterium]